MSARLAREFAYLSRMQFRNHGAQRRNERTKIDQTIGFGPKNDHCEGALLELLLHGEVFVNRDQDIEAPRHDIQQGAIIKVSPPHFRGGSHLVSRQLPREAPWHAAVQQHTHRVRNLVPLRGYCLVQESGLRKLQHRYRVLTRNTRKIREEFVQRIAGFEIINQRLYWHPRSREDGSPAEAIGRRGYKRLRR